MPRDHTKRLGKIMPLQTSTGDTYPTTFWCVSRTVIDVETEQVIITFMGWRSIEDYEAEKQPVGHRQISFAGPEFDDVATRSMNLPANIPELARDNALAWQIAFETKDTPVEQGGETILKSFFERATDPA